MSDHDKRVVAELRVRKKLSLVNHFVESVLGNPSVWTVCASDVESACDDMRQYLVNYVNIVTKQKEDQP